VYDDRFLQEIWTTFEEIWGGDAEYHSKGKDGNPPVPVSYVAKELKSGRVVRVWLEGQKVPACPHRTDAGVLYLAFALDAELPCFSVLGWKPPVNAIDLLAEYRRLVFTAADTKFAKDKFTLLGVLRHIFGGASISAGHKKDWRDRIIAGPPYLLEEQCGILDYNETDVHPLGPLFRAILPHMGELRHALYRGRYFWPMARMMLRGIPVDYPRWLKFTSSWPTLQDRLIEETDRKYGMFEGRTLKDNLILAYALRKGIDWPLSATGKPLRNEEVRRDLVLAHPELQDWHELVTLLKIMERNKIAIGDDGRNRTGLMPFATKTGRNAPSNSKYIFGPAKVFRFFIQPPPGRVLIHRDFSQQEIAIAAIVSGDMELLREYESGDVYIAMAKRFGFVPADATKASHPDIRNMFKVVTLAILYGMSARGLAKLTGLTRFEANALLIKMRVTYRKFWEYVDAVIHDAAFYLEIRNPYGWRMSVPPGSNPRAIQNFPMQSRGACILQASSILGEGRGIELIAPVHDALMCEGPADCEDDVSYALDETMRDASRAVLQGFELRTDVQVIRSDGRYYEKRAVEMWERINRLIDGEGVRHG
jgi:hypothetical protein